MFAAIEYSISVYEAPKYIAKLKNNHNQLLQTLKATPKKTKQ